MSSARGGLSDISFDKPIQFSEAQTAELESILLGLAALDQYPPDWMDPIRRAALRPLSVWARAVLGEVEWCGCR